ERAEDDGARARRLAAAADHARRAGLPRHATALRTLSLRRKAVSAARGQTELTRGLQALRAGEVINAREALHLAATLYRHADRPEDELTALLHAAEASWTAGDGAGYAGAALRIGGHGAAPEEVRDYFRGVAAALRCDHARSVPALRAASLHGAAAADAHPAVPALACRAALMLGDVSHARDLAGRALARAAGPQRTVPELLGLLALVELVADNHARAGAHAERGLEAA
ncbi:LuxR family transcriptional regulator, partial [Streptosporangium nondiastaticum]